MPRRGAQCAAAGQSKILERGKLNECAKRNRAPASDLRSNFDSRVARGGICLRWSRPLAFVVLAGFGGGLIAAGVLYFRYSLLVVEREGRAANSPAGNEK
jgi:hypothetical protein